MPRTTFVIHDWNGSLIDDVPHRFAHGPLAIFRHFGLPEPTIEDYCQHITSDFMTYYYDRGVPNGGDRKKDGDMLNAIMTANMARVSVPPLFPETREVLEAIAAKGITQVLVSSMEEGEFRRQLGHHGLEKFFLEIHGGIRGKTAPTFRNLLTTYDIDPATAFGVTDTMSDVRELAEVGVRPIIVPRGYSVPKPEEIPTLVVANDLRHTLEIIRGA